MNVLSFGEYLKMLREKKSLSTHKLAELSGVSQSYISHVESGRKKRTPSPEILYKLKDHLDVSHYELMVKAGHIRSSAVEIEPSETEYEKELSEKKKQMLNELDNSIKDKASIDKFFEENKDAAMFYDGRELTPEDRRRILDMLKVLFPDNKGEA